MNECEFILQKIKRHSLKEWRYRTANDLRHLMLDPQLVCDHRDELAVGRLRLADVDRVAEDEADAVDVASGPGHFNGVADSPLDAARGRFEFLRDGRVKGFGDGCKVLSRSLNTSKTRYLSGFIGIIYCSNCLSLSIAEAMTFCQYLGLVFHCANHYPRNAT